MLGDAHPELMHQGLSWYAVYFLFQATLVLDVHHLEKSQPQESAHDVDEYAWGNAVSRARQCFADLGAKNKAASRCLSVLDRIHNRFNLARANGRPTGATENSQPASATFENNLGNTAPHEQTTPDSANIMGGQWALAADPSLYMFLNDAPMDNLFQDFQGFPSTLEPEYFDYAPGNLFDFTDSGQDQAANSTGQSNWHFDAT